MTIKCESVLLLVLLFLMSGRAAALCSNINSGGAVQACDTSAQCAAFSASIGQTYALYNGPAIYILASFEVDGYFSTGPSCAVVNPRNPGAIVAAFGDRVAALESGVVASNASLATLTALVGTFQTALTSLQATVAGLTGFVDQAVDPAVMSEFWGYGFGLMIMMFVFSLFIGEIIGMIKHAK